MNVTQNWIPFETVYEKSLVDGLTDRQRVFWKCLRFNLPARAAMANAVITDTPEATALCILPPGATDEDLQELSRQVGSDEMPLWFWRAGEEEMPDFPATEEFSGNHS